MESLMLFALGFLIATLFAIIAGQFIWRRAVAVTSRNLSGGDGHVELQALLADRNSQLAELGERLERLEEQGAPSPIPADHAEKHQNLAEQLHQTEVEAERLRSEEAETSREMESLRARLTDMEASLSRSEAERREQEEQISAMTRRIGEFEAELEEEAHRKEGTYATLRAIGERAARLAYDLNNLIEEAAPRTKSNAPAEERPKPVVHRETEKAEATDEPRDEDIADSLEELTDRIHAAYGAPETTSAPTNEADRNDAGKAENKNDNDKAPSGQATGSPLDDRIRALEAGLPH